MEEEIRALFIERLTLKNFKSFGGTHELPFAPGFTAIVGPNGSGKSNILDGLRWVLGESSANRLRITRQSDLIFQGSAGMSEATETDVLLGLVDGDLHGVLRRHLDASGGVVFVNEKRSRIQDLAHFKQQWHLEGDRSAFIGQGEVGAAVLQKPFQRRLQLEELFGIDVYRKKRDNALDELKVSNDELLRLQSLMAELKARREQIAPDLQNARKARDYQERLEKLRSSLYFYRRYAEQLKLKSLEDKHLRAQARVPPAKRWSEIWKLALDNLRQQGNEYTQLRTRLNDELKDLTPRLDDVVRRQVALNTEKSENDFVIKSLNEENVKLESQLKKEESTRDELALQTGKLKQESSSLCVRVQDLEDKLSQRDEKIDESRRRRQKLLEDEAALLEEARQQNARADALETQGRDRASALDDLRAKRDKIVTDLTESDEVLEALEDSLEQIEKRRSDWATRSQELAIRAQSLRRSVARAEAELDAMLQRSEAGLYPKPVQMILSAVKLGRLKIDTVPAVEAFKCDASLAMCLEAYLGGRQYWLLVDTMAQAKVGIELLRERNGGRATFLPLERCRANKVGKAPTGTGVLGWAIDLVKPENRWLPAVVHLLGNLLVVKDYDTGAKLAFSARYPIVTLDGDVFSPSGTVSGGKTSRSVGAITLRNQIEVTEKNIAADKQVQLEVAKKLDASEKAEAKMSAELESKRKEVDAQKAKTDALRRSLREQTDELNVLLQEDSNSAARIAQCREMAKKNEDAAAKVRNEINSIPLIETDDAESKELADLRTQSLVIDERLSAKQRELEKSVRDVSDIRRSMFENNTQSRRLVQKLTEISERAEQLLAERNEREDEKKSIEQRITDLDSRNAKAARRMERQLLRSQKAHSAFETAIREEMAARTDLENSRERLKNLLDSNEEKYPYPQDFEPYGESIEKLDNSCRYVERALRDLGDVNMGALSEDQSLAERLKYLDEQLKDVQRGMEQLNNVIATTDKQAATVFGNALTQIDKRFDELFQRLFGGGEAHLRAQPEMPLWDAGVEIIARPPGKKTLFLAQLSGGEQSLTALSLLFASMEVARVPMAVLDEVDAALDEANLTRFALMVAEYSKTIQVIAMTHRRQTMEHADVMYGVTMSEPGLSQIVGVKVDQWS